MQKDFIFYNFEMMCYYLLKELERKTNVNPDTIKIFLNQEPEKYNAYAFYDKKEKEIKVNLNDFTRFILNESEFREELGRGFDFLLAHEIGHYIHDVYFQEEGFSFSDKNKIPNSCKNKNENFADCFADWLINNKETKERNNDMEKILLEKGLLKY